MNHPRFSIFVTPINNIKQLVLEKNMFEKTRGVYKPPQHECDIIKKIQDSGFAPTINANTECTVEQAHGVCGIVVVERGLGYDMHVAKHYDICQGRIFCLIWFQKEMSYYNLGIVKDTFATYFGAPGNNRSITRSSQCLIDDGCLVAPSECCFINGSKTFSGSLIIKENPIDDVLMLLD